MRPDVCHENSLHRTTAELPWLEPPFRDPLDLVNVSSMDFGDLPDRGGMAIVHSVIHGAEVPMPRASWRGFLRLSLVSCPIYLSPASTRTKSIRLNQVWQPRTTRPAAVEDDEEEEQLHRPDARSFSEDVQGDALTEPLLPTRVALHPHDPHTGKEIEREEVVKGYEYERGRFVTFTADELKALDVESSKIIDLKPSCREPRSTPFFSALRTTSIRTALSPLKRSA